MLMAISGQRDVSLGFGRSLSLHQYQFMRRREKSSYRDHW
ncbi:hypothetical protein SynSYN20_01041 [Synechococcus sp. SYN20]|nr:hypothetical protein SynSYN20_01041 [Synechococcus sp. SYN20]